MKTLLRLACLFPLLTVALSAATLNYDINLRTPRFDSLDAAITAPGGTTNVHISVIYNAKGQPVATAELNGAPATKCKATFKSSTNGVGYTFTINSTSTPPTTITLSGSLATNVAKCAYTGPLGRTNIAAQPVTLASTKPVPTSVFLDPATSIKNAITGTGRVETAFCTNLPVLGSLKGKVSTNKLTWTLKQGTRNVTFTGSRTNDSFIGTLRVTVPPAKETFTGYAVPAADFPVVSGPAFFRGTVTAVEGMMPAVAAKVAVRIQSDLNGNGRFDKNESFSSVTDAQGRYQIKANVILDRPVLVGMEKTGFAGVMQTYPSVSPGSLITKNAGLQPLTSLMVDSGTASAPDESIRLEGLPPNIDSVDARVFNPGTETSRFPGAFADNRSNLLVSTVFSAIEARDASGKPVTNLGTNATLCMQIPPDCWPTLGDTTNNTGQIDIPLYYFDETDGQWKRNPADGHLEDESRNIIPESALASIRNGSYSGVVCAVGPITHLSYWNVDWPIDTHSCVQGVIVGTNGLPISGASVSVSGVTYTGTSSPKVTSADGGFASDVMRSEQTGEDVDRDGVTGEVQQVNVRVSVGNNIYSFGPFEVPETPATVTDGNCLNLGNLVIDDANKLTLGFCTISGRVTYSGDSLLGNSPLSAGDPIPGATVIGFDPDAVDALGFCLASNGCMMATTDADGRYTLNAPFLSSLVVIVSASTNDANGLGVYSGFAETSICPTGDFNLTTDYFSINLLFAGMTDSRGNEIGAFFVSDDSGFVTFVIGRTPYFASGATPSTFPTALGAWFSLPLIRGDNGNPAGNITFNVTSLNPIAGTWTTSGGSANASGQWASQSLF